jgi:hypothetical protein
MQKYDLEELKKQVSASLSKQAISGRVLLDRFCMIEESSRKSPSYSDPNYAGFYYHLGKNISPSSLLELNFELGIFSGSFMTSCKTVERFCGWHENDGNFFSFRIGARNIKKVHKKQRILVDTNQYDDRFEKVLKLGYDMIIFTQEHRYDRQLNLLEFFWKYLNENGIIVCDNTTRSTSTNEAFEAFAFSKNTNSIKFETRHGTSLLQK